MNAIETALTIIAVAAGITAVANLYSLLRHIKRAVRRTLDRA